MANNKKSSNKSSKKAKSTSGVKSASSASAQKRKVETSPSGRPMPAGKVPKKGRKAKESDFFYVNRKIPCFLLFVCSLVLVAVFAINMLPLVGSLKDNDMITMLGGYTALYQVKDMTSEDKRVDTVNEAGETVAYQDKTQYVSMADMLMGAINNLTGKYAQDMTETATTETAPAETTEESTAVETPSFYDKLKEQEKLSGYTEGLPLTLISYAPLAMVLIIIAALICMVKAFLALFGRRIFKGFGLGSVFALVGGVGALLAAVGIVSLLLAVQTGAETLELQFGGIVDFLMGAFSAPPATEAAALEAQAAATEAAAAATAAGETPALATPFYAGYGTFAVLALPIVMLLLSAVSKKKIPYSIFD